MLTGSQERHKDLMVIFDRTVESAPSSAGPMSTAPSAWADPSVQFIWAFSVVMAMAVFVVTALS